MGPGVDALVAALTALHPFENITEPTDVALAGYPGTHLEWVVPDMPTSGTAPDLQFMGCELGKLKSWVAFIDAEEPRDAFHGNTGPGYREESWILDVDGVRLMIAAEHFPGRRKPTRMSESGSSRRSASSPESRRAARNGAHRGAGR